MLGSGRDTILCPGAPLMVTDPLMQRPGAQFTVLKWDQIEAQQMDSVPMVGMMGDTTTEYTVVVVDNGGLGDTVLIDHIRVEVHDSTFALVQPGIDYKVSPVANNQQEVCFYNSSIRGVDGYSFTWILNNNTVNTSDPWEVCDIVSIGSADPDSIPYNIKLITESLPCGDTLSPDTVSIDLLFLKWTGFDRQLRLEKPDIEEALEERLDEGQWITAYPNPTDGKVTLAYQLKQSAGFAEIRCVNALGQWQKKSALDTKVGQLEWDCSTWPRGIYFYTLFVDGIPISTHKLVVE
jgi:hypothetical protein